MSKRIRPDESTVRNLYLDQQLSSTAIAKLYDVGFSAVCGWLKVYGIPTRNPSEAKRLDMARWSQMKRLQITAVSRAIITGRKRTLADLCKRALGKQMKAKLSPNEIALMFALAMLGLQPIPQFAVSKYNLDFAFPLERLAVEVDGGNWHRTCLEKITQDKAKTSFLLNSQWRMLRISTRRRKWIPYSVNMICIALSNR